MSLLYVQCFVTFILVVAFLEYHLTPFWMWSIFNASFALMPYHYVHFRFFMMKLWVFFVEAPLHFFHHYSNVMIWFQSKTIRTRPDREIFMAFLVCCYPLLAQWKVSMLILAIPQPEYLNLSIIFYFIREWERIIDFSSVLQLLSILTEAGQSLYPHFLPKAQLKLLIFWPI